MNRTRVLLPGLLLLGQISCTAGYQRSHSGLGGPRSGMRVGPEGAPIVAVSRGEKPKIDRSRPVKPGDHRHLNCDHPMRAIEGRAFHFHENRWEAEVDGVWIEAPDEPAPGDDSGHPNAPR